MKKTLLFFAVATIIPVVAMAQNNVYLSTSGDAVDFSKIKEQTKSVTLTRYLMEGYNTVCLPFSVSADDLRAAVGQDVQLERLARVEGNKLFFLDVTSEGIEAGVPYLIYSPVRKVALFKTAEKQMTEPVSLTVDGATMFSSYQKDSPSGVYGIPALQDTDVLQSVLVSVDGDKSFLPTRCGISVSCDNPEICHVTSLSETTTSIDALIDSEDAIVNVYSIDGVLVASEISMSKALNTLPKGIYVAGGQKFIVK